MTKDLQKKLKSRWQTFTTSEQKIASYLLNNISGIPFETAASLGKRVGVSAMTVGRFLRNLGYAGVGDLKEELRGEAPWLKLYRAPEQARDADFITENLQAEIRGLTDVHALARSEEWKPIVRLLATADRVSVGSFQQGRFLGLGFATLLQHVRPHVIFESGVDGAYTDMLLDSTSESCVVLIDVRRYSRHFRILAEEVVERGIPLIIITDPQCYWARQLTPNVLMVPIHADRAWHSFGAFTGLFSLLISAVTRETGDVLGRIGDITRLRQKFIGYAGPSLAGRAEPRPGPPEKRSAARKPRRKS
jgi:DNA-binding MurR/RpiR family transcriptional regulator